MAFEKSTIEFELIRNTIHGSSYIMRACEFGQIMEKQMIR